MDAKKIELGWLEGISPEDSVITGSVYAKAATGIKEFPDEAAVVKWLLGYKASAGTAYAACQHNAMERSFVRACQLAKQGKPLRSPAEAWQLMAEGITAADNPAEGHPDGEVASVNAEKKLAALQSAYDGVVLDRDKWKAKAEDLQAKLTAIETKGETGTGGKPSGG